ncbi:MAG: acyl-CoA reductase, partial [Gemmatimonadota bacterium]
MSAAFDAWWLPAGTEDAEIQTLEVGDLECRYPAPTPTLIEASVRTLRDAGRELAERPVDDVVATIDRVAARLRDPGHPVGAEAERLVTAATGYHPAMTRLVLDRMSADWAAGPTRRLLRSELGDPAVLDRFVPAPGNRRRRAYGPQLAFHVFAGNVPGVAVTSLVRSLLVKGPVLGKLAAGQPVLPVLFARAVHAVDPALARALAVTYWPGGAA